MTQTKYLNCIVCPLSCKIKVQLEDGQIKSIEGYSCPRGKVYAQEELTSPKRMLTTTVKINGGILPLLPVVSQTTLPKDKIMQSAIKLRNITVNAPIKKGDIIMKDILGLGVDIVASRSMEKI